MEVVSTDFNGFGKIPRLSRPIVITEKLDGTNGQINIFEILPGTNLLEYLNNVYVFIVDEATYGVPGKTTPGKKYGVMAGSRNRWIAPGDDNYGFAKWVWENARQLVALLGEGRHYGEWWGQGIQRKYGKTEKTFSLFNTKRWNLENLHEPEMDWAPIVPQLSVVPTLYEGEFTTERVEWTLEALRDGGSFAAPGFMNPEGIIIYHTAGNLLPSNRQSIRINHHNNRKKVTTMRELSTADKARLLIRARFDS